MPAGAGSPHLYSQQWCFVTRFWCQVPGHVPLRGEWQVGSLTGVLHLSNGNAGVLRRAQGGQKPPVEQKGKSSLDLDFQYEYRP